MASWVDVLSLILTLGLAGIIVLGLLYFGRLTSKAAEATKASLKDKGVNISKEGVSIKTNKRWDRGDYIDATQRGLVKAYNTSSYGPGLGAGVRSHSASSIHAQEHHEGGRDRHGTVTGASHGYGIKKTASAQ